MTSKITLLLLSTVLICSVAVAQNKIITQKVAGGSADDRFSSLSLTSDGGYIVGGTSTSGASGNKTQPSRGQQDFWIVKYDKNGAIEWDKTIGSEGSDALTGVQQTTDGGYIAGGTTDGRVSGDRTSPVIGIDNYWLVKLDKNGNIQWDKCISTNFTCYSYCVYSLQSFQQTSDHGYILAGLVDQDPDVELPRFYRVVKVDSMGNMQWEHEYIANNVGGYAAMQQTPDGGYILAGTTTTNNEAYSFPAFFQVFKIDKNGNQEWEQEYRDSSLRGNSAMFTSLIQVNNGYILGGYSTPDWGTPDTAINDGLLLRIDKTGNKISSKRIGGSGIDRITSLQKTSDGRLLAGGWSNSPKSGDKSENSRGGFDYWVVKMDAAGNIIWDKTYGGSDDDMLVTAIERKPDEYILGGYSSSGYSGDKRVPSMGGIDYWGIVMEHTAPDIKPLIAAAPDFSVYPNPAATTINIFTKHKAQFILSNLLGRPIASKVIENNGTMDVSRLTPGVYFITNLSTGKKQGVIITR